METYEQLRQVRDNLISRGLIIEAVMIADVLSRMEERLIKELLLLAYAIIGSIAAVAFLAHTM